MPRVMLSRHARAAIVTACAVSASVAYCLARGGPTRASAASGYDLGATSGYSQGATSGTDAAVPDAAVPVPTYGVTLVFVTGQSLSVGDNSTQATFTSPFGNTMLNDSTGNYAFSAPDAATLALGPLLGGGRFQAVNQEGLGPYPINIGPTGTNVERPDPTMANEFTSLTGIVVDAEGVGANGTPLADISDGGLSNSWDAMMYSTRAVCNLAHKAGLSCGVLAVMMINGQTDDTNTQLEAGYVQWQAVAQAAFQAITGQTAGVPVIIAQQSGGPPGTGPGVLNISGMQQQATCVDHPGQFMCSYPDYMEPPYTADYLHKVDYRAGGEKMGQILAQYVGGKHYVPMLAVASNITCTGSTVTVCPNVPVPPIVLDNSVPLPHQPGLLYGSGGTTFPTSNGWTGLYGFGAWTGGVGGTAIAGTGPATVTNGGTCISLPFASAPDTLEYGYTSDTNSFSNSYFARRGGGVRDSDPMIGYTHVTPLTDAAAPAYGTNPNFMFTNQWPVTCH